MKTRIYILAAVLLHVNFSFSRHVPKDPNDIVAEMTTAIRLANWKYSALKFDKESELQMVSKNLYAAQSVDAKVSLLLRKDQLKDEIAAIARENNNEISKIRYLKGLQVIKSLYEKVLGLDHHFASVRTLSEINRISNPNQYPEYTKLKEVVSAKKDKKFGVDLTSVLGTNSIVSLVQTFTNMIGSALTKEEKEKELARVECILDFTLRMQNDLNTIFFETAFLQTSNNKVKEDIETLFRDYTKPIGYMPSLEDCRKNDDWEAITQKMDEYLSKMKTASGSAQYKMQVNVEFPIDRLMQFITQYNNFIDQGGKFYEKFKIILSSYENEQQCESKLPPEYKKLKSDIDLAIQKFNTAYKPVEINGTKMKEILYGLNEFD
jgi:translation initiation factor 2 beta subunit (eIF-2beta)/eIF-5